MWLKRLFAHSIFVGVLMFSISMVTKAQDSDHPALNLPIPKSHLTSDELNLAVEIGANEVFSQNQVSILHMDSQRIVLSDVESVDDNNPESQLALVTTYHYDTNQTIRRLVDLINSKVVNEQVIDGGSASLAEIEQVAAEFLVRENTPINDFLGAAKNELKVETILSVTKNPESQFYHKRVVLVLLKTIHGYPQFMPKIFVNLTDLEVVIQE